MISVEHAEDIVGKRCRVAVREEGPVYVLKLLFRQQARGAILDESWSPLDHRLLVHARAPMRPGPHPPLYHCCNSFLSKCVDLDRSSSCAGESLDCLAHTGHQYTARVRVRAIPAASARAVQADSLLSHYVVVMRSCGPLCSSGPLKMLLGVCACLLLPHTWPAVLADRRVCVSKVGGFSCVSARRLRWQSFGADDMHVLGRGGAGRIVCVCLCKTSTRPCAKKDYVWGLVV